MDIIVYRQPVKGKPTLGEMHIDGEFFCYTLEDEDRGILNGMSFSRVKELKRYGETCIGYGSYTLTLGESVKFKRVLPLLHKVTGFEGIRIHRGNFASDSLGCILVGYGKENFTITHSKQCEIDLVKKLSNQVRHSITFLKAQ